MNEEMKKAYRDTFSEIHAPEALSRKVLNMVNESTNNKGISSMRRWVSVAAMALVVLAGSNGIVYAATGSTWLQNVVVHFSGSSAQAELAAEVNEEDAVTYTVSAPTEAGAGDVDGEEVDITEGSEIEVLPYVVTPSKPKVIEEDDLIFLQDGDIKIDITYDLNDGAAIVSYEKDGMVNAYTVTGKDGNWTITSNIGTNDLPVRGGNTGAVETDAYEEQESVQPAATE